MPKVADRRVCIRDCVARSFKLTMPVGDVKMQKRFKTATGLVLALVLAGVTVSSHAQTAGLAYRLTVTIDGVEESCREAGGEEFYVRVKRRDFGLQDQIRAADGEAAQIADLADPGIALRLPDLETAMYGTAYTVRQSLSARVLHSELDPLSETERRSLERLRGVRSSDRTDDERRELEALASLGCYCSHPSGCSRSRPASATPAVSGVTARRVRATLNVASHKGQG